MNWFKHYANMATDERMMRMESEMGYIGTGIFWRAMELINGMGGSYPLKGLLYTIKNRHAKQGKVMQVIMGYGLFEVDSVGLVRFCEVSKRVLAEPSQLPNGTASEDAIIGTRVSFAKHNRSSYTSHPNPMTEAPFYLRTVNILTTHGQTFDQTESNN